MNWKRCLICGKKLDKDKKICSSEECPFKVSSDRFDENQENAKPVNEFLELKNWEVIE